MKINRREFEEGMKSTIKITCEMKCLRYILKLANERCQLSNVVSIIC